MSATDTENQSLGGGFAQLLANRDVVFALGVVMILGMLFVPLPPVMLDFGLAISLSLAVLILMVALWIPTPLDFNSFPTLLLMVTMLRLALNVSSTRLILSQGHTGTDAAGKVIEGFSRFINKLKGTLVAIFFALFKPPKQDWLKGLGQRSMNFLQRKGIMMNNITYNRSKIFSRKRPFPR